MNESKYVCGVTSISNRLLILILVIVLSIRAENCGSSISSRNPNLLQLQQPNPPRTSIIVIITPHTPQNRKSKGSNRKPNGRRRSQTRGWNCTNGNLC